LLHPILYQVIDASEHFTSPNLIPIPYLASPFLYFSELSELFRCTDRVPREQKALTGEVGTTPVIKIITYIPLPSKETTERTERAIVCRAVTENYPA